ncbi:MAG: hypothetical protein F9K29_04575 [Hyphomicrobiaceae bacterium]|nr:MAG: hypothetical protein F9K29_04575 [Hyphomicrobiaceae bacterium]
MAMILEFRSDMSRGEPRDIAETRGAEIIIFPGVRRERHTETSSEASKPRRREKVRTKRDRLELPD